MNNFIVLPILLSLFASLLDCEVNSTQKKQLIDIHNKYRRDVAQGKAKDQPSASDMMELKWNDEAARMAQDYANQCVFKHNEKKERQYGNYSWVGQNLARWTSKDNITHGVSLWYKEVLGYSFNHENCSIKACGHYTALAWALTSELGCGFTDCSSKKLGMYLVCHYGPGGNIAGKKMYVVGAACKNCPKQTKCKDGLCA